MTDSNASRPSEDPLFDDKLALLELYYPNFLKSSLSELLKSCGSSVDDVRSLISGVAPKKRVALTQGNLLVWKKGRSQNGDPAINHANEPKDTAKLIPSKFKPREKVVLNTPEDVKRYLAPYASLHLNFLPSRVSDSLLNELMECRNTFKYNQFYLFGNQCELSHLVGMFARPEAEYARLVYNGLKRSKPAPYTASMEDACSILERFINEEVIPREPPSPWSVNAREDPICERKACENALKDKPFNKKYLANEKSAPKIKQLETSSASNTNEPRSQDSNRHNAKQSDADANSWTSDFCLVNCYEKLDSNLAWHSDRLSHIGPLNYVASLSLGATRVFRLRRNYDKNSPTFHIPLPHNSVLLMKPGCQEEFQHCVGIMSKAIALHETSGSIRFGLTSRHYPPFFIENLPKCQCNLGMILRRSYKNVAIRGQYFWACENIYQNKDCGDFHWADFNNVTGHYIAKDKTCISTWIAPEDHEKWAYEESKNEIK